MGTDEYIEEGAQMGTVILRDSLGIVVSSVSFQRAATLIDAGIVETETKGKKTELRLIPGIIPIARGSAAW